MTTIVTADLHASGNPRDEYRFKFLEKELPTISRELEARRLIILGDLTEAKSGHSAALVNRVVDALAKLAEGLDIIIVKGNHDYRAEDTPFFRFLQHIPRVRWINEPETIKLRGLGRCLLLPHVRRPEDWGSIEAGYDLVFCHQTFSGAASEAGQRLEGFPRDLFGGGARVISGDVHVPQDIHLPDNGLLIYAGCPYHKNFGDSFDPRVLAISDSGNIRSVDVEGPRRCWVGAGATRKGEIIYSADGVEPGDMIKVRIALDRSDLARGAARRMVQAWADERRFILQGVEVIKSQVKPGKTVDGRPQQSDAELVQAYAKKMKKGKVTLAAGMKIVEEVK